MIRSFLTLLLISCFALCGNALKLLHINEAVRDSLRQELAQAQTPVDSLKIAIDLLDATPNVKGIPYGELSYRLARRLGYDQLSYSLFGQLVDISSLDHAQLLKLQSYSNQFPNGAMKKALQTYIRLRITYFDASSYNPQKLSQLINHYIDEVRTDSGDVYDRIERMFAVCIYLHALYDESDLLSFYYDQLEPLIQSLPEDNWFLRRFFYNQAANSYSVQFDPTRALEADRKLLPLLREQRARDFSNNRNYHTLGTYFYNVYRRMLANHEMLTPQEIDSVYNNVLYIVDHNDIAREDFNKNRRPQIYYHMAHKNYRQALDEIKKVIDNPENERFHYYLNRAMITASRAIGDKESELDASRRYIDRLQKYIDLKSERSLQELTVVYELNEHKARIDDLYKTSLKEQATYHRHLIIGSSVALVLIAIIAALLWIQWRRARKSAASEKQANAKLVTERDNLRKAQENMIIARDKAKETERQKTDFINLMSHQVKAPLAAISEYSNLIVDCMDAKKRRYLEKYANIVSANTDLILSMVNDISEVTSLESNTVEINNQPTNINDICRVAISSVEHSVPENMEIEMVEGSQERIPIDGRRLEQILTNLLENAIKFAESGKITVDFEIDNQVRQLRLSVSDRGPGIPVDKREVIFNRFIKLDPQSTGLGLGLYASRILARLMGGEINIDPTYRRGARFIVRIPF